MDIQWEFACKTAGLHHVLATIAHSRSTPPLMRSCVRFARHLGTCLPAVIKDPTTEKSNCPLILSPGGFRHLVDVETA